ncbi:MAG: hypothetical protein GF331_23985 [Chitinivibrionales bacterium]|nr:hypothetical protein [Chitinivibrionales bacterium]
MDQKQLKKLIALGEGQTIEFKQSVGSQLGREMCAMANTIGGTVLVGVNDGGEITKLGNQNRLKSQVQSIAREMDPPLTVKVSSVGGVLVVVVPESRAKPHSVAGRFYLREGASSQQMRRSEIREFFFREGLVYFDEAPNGKFRLTRDFSKESYSQFLEASELPRNLARTDVLRNLKVVADGKMTNAGALLFCRKASDHLISATVTCVLFQGTDKVKILDQKVYDRDLVSNYRDAVVYLQSHLNTEYIITLTRTNKLELPEEALREALLNALAHRDYRSSANVQVYIFSDRVEIVNPGGLVAGMKLEDLGRKSMPRNPLLFGLLHRMHLVENVGSGMKRMNQLLKADGLPPLQVEADENWFTVTFRRSVTDRPQSQLESQPESQPESRRIAGRLLALLISEPLSKKQMSTALGQKAISGQLNTVVRELVSDGLIEYTIPDKPTSRLQKYRLTGKGRREASTNAAPKVPEA